MSKTGRPHSGRMRVKITAKYKGVVCFYAAGPANIVYGKYRKWLRTLDPRIRRTLEMRRT